MVAASTEVASEADLQAILRGEPAEVFMGDLVTYTLTVTNAGPSMASNVTATLHLPIAMNVEGVSVSSGTCPTNTRCELGDLNAGGAAIIRWRVRVAQWPGASVSVQAEVSTDAIDPDLMNNRAEVHTTVRFRVFLPMIFR